MIEWDEHPELKKVTLFIDARMSLSQQQMLTAIESILSNNNLCISDVGLISYMYASKASPDILDFALEHAIKTTKICGSFPSLVRHRYGYDCNDDLITFDYMFVFVSDYYSDSLKGIKNLYIVDTKNEYKIIY